MNLTIFEALDPTDVKWERAQFNEELEEFRRVSGDTGIVLRDLRDAYKKASLQPLDEADWSRLENTDSYDIHDIAELKRLSEIYDRDYRSILNAIDNSDTLPAPIILSYNGELTLVAGNTRLMCCRLRSIIPEVIILKI